MIAAIGCTRSGRGMSGFWIAGIAVNLVFFGALVWWGVRNWRGRGDRDDRGDRG